MKDQILPIGAILMVVVLEIIVIAGGLMMSHMNKAPIWKGQVAGHILFYGILVLVFGMVYLADKWVRE